MRFIKGLLFVFGMMLVASPAAEARQAVSAHEKLVDGFVYLVDNSGSMMMKHGFVGEQKIEMAKEVILEMEQFVPELGFKSAVALFSPNVNTLPAQEWTYMDVDYAVLGISNKAPIFGRHTKMGEAFPALASTISSVGSKAAVFMISDGTETLGQTPVQAAEALYMANPNALIHVISLADTKEGEERLMAVANLKSNSAFIDGRLLLDSEKIAKDFVEGTIYQTAIPGQIVEVTEEVLFQVNKWDILEREKASLNAFLDVLKTRKDLKVLVQGYASPEGSLARNNMLSENRAKEVTNYMLNYGIEADQIVTKAFGPTDYYPSYELDRRVDLYVIWD